MCLAIPAKLLEKNGDEALIDLQGSRMKVNVQLTPEAQPGDWLLVHAGFAIQRLDAKDAEETFALLAEMKRLSPGDGAELTAASGAGPAKEGAQTGGGQGGPGTGLGHPMGGGLSQ